VSESPSLIAWVRESAGQFAVASLQSSHRLNLFLRYGRSRIPTKPVFVVCSLRSGSNLLVSYLNSTPGVSIAGEILHPDQVHGVPRTGVSKKGVLKHIRRSLNKCGAEVCGAKLPSVHLKLHNMNVRELHDYFPTSKVILLYRRSIADQYLSFQVARVMKRWRWGDGRDPQQPSEKVRIDRNEFLKYARELKDFYARTLSLDGFRSYAIVVSYEDLVAKPKELFDTQLFPFLGLAPSPISTTQVKAIKGHPSEVVEDYDSVRDLWEHPEFIQTYC
jgi:LPS sulfotransferase NodH